MRKLFLAAGLFALIIVPLLTTDDGLGVLRYGSSPLTLNISR